MVLRLLIVEVLEAESIALLISIDIAVDHEEYILYPIPLRPRSELSK